MTEDIRDRAREFRALSGPEAIRAHTGVSDTEYAYVCAIGEAQEIIGDLLAMIARILDGHDTGSTT